MTKINHFVGVDVSKDKFDVWDNVPGTSFLSERPARGIASLPNNCRLIVFCVMEATASYYQQLAMYLYEA